MDDSEVDYDAYDLSEFTAADFAHIDGTTREHDPAHSNATSDRGAWKRVEETSGSGGPQIAVALECGANEPVVVKVASAGGSESCQGDAVGSVQIVDDSDKGKSDRLFKAANSRSPHEVYRPGGYLSVSDLVGPAWCEVQYDYGLRQGRSRPLADRPNTFVSAKGKVITVDKQVAEVNEQVLINGRSVHKELERELHPEQVSIVPETVEEFWASRLISMLGRLDILMQESCCREMPVFGVVQDQPIVGVIDEISLKTISESEAEPNSRRKRALTPAQGTSRTPNKQQEQSPSQSHAADFFTSPSKARRSSSPKRPIYELSLKDTKTRRTNSLPSDDDALSSRMQLMLYHHLLSELLSPTFSFSTFWEKIHVNPFESFSDKFLLETGLARETDGKITLGYPDCLDDLADLWRSMVNSFRLRGVSPTLEIAYRTQPKRSAALGQSRTDVLGYFAAASQEERDLQRAIAESLRHTSPRGAEQLSDMPPIRWYTRIGELESASAQPEIVETARPMQECNTAELGPSEWQAPTSQPESSKIIGRKIFDFDEAAMQAHVRDVLQWWRGERRPRGVEVEHSRRCFSCEYMENCEWREKKAREAQAKYSERK